MIVKFQKSIEIVNKCGAIFDENELKDAIVWYSEKPVTRIKRVYMYGEYPAVSIYDQKIHIHRLLMMYWENRQLDTEEYVHHKNENKLCAVKGNLELLPCAKHQSHHNKGKTLSAEHRAKISDANRRRRNTKYRKRIDLPLIEINNMLAEGKSINHIANHFGVDHSTIKSRIYENPSLLEDK